NGSLALALLLAATLHRDRALVPRLGDVLARDTLGDTDPVLAPALVKDLDLRDLALGVDPARFRGPEVDALEADVGDTVAGVDLARSALCTHHVAFVLSELRFQTYAAEPTGHDA